MRCMGFRFPCTCALGGLCCHADGTKGEAHCGGCKNDPLTSHFHPLRAGNGSAGLPVRHISPLHVEGCAECSLPMRQAASLSMPFSSCLTRAGFSRLYQLGPAGVGVLSAYFDRPRSEALTALATARSARRCVHVAKARGRRPLPLAGKPHTQRSPTRGYRRLPAAFPHARP